MSLGIVQYAVIILLLLVTINLLRRVIALRYQLRLGRVGFFSIASIRYHRSDNNQELWSFSCGKVKARLKRPPYHSPSAWISINVSDICIRLNSIGIFKSSTHRRPAGNLNRHLSTMGARLTSIRWWSSLPVVKQIIKSISGLPAQLMMAGLANYVDIQVDGLKLSVANVGTFHVDSVNFSCVLFAATAPKNTRSPFPVQPPSTVDTARGSTESENGHDISFHYQHQRHSLKRAQHLFKEKFLEVRVQVGHAGFSAQPHDGSGPKTDIVYLPMGSRIAISCHLSAGCITLKDIDVKMQIDALQVRLEQVAQLGRVLHSIQSSSKNQPAPAIQQKRQQKKMQLLAFLRTFNLSITEAALTFDSEQGPYTSLRMRSIAVKLTAPVIVHAPPSRAQFEMQGSIGQTTWSIFNNKPDLATECIEPLVIPKIQLSAASSESLMHPQADTRTGDPQVTIEDLNIYTVHATLLFQAPKVSLALEKQWLLKDLMKSTRTKTEADPTPTRHAWWTGMKSFGQLPRLVMSVSLADLVLDIVNGNGRQDPNYGHGITKCGSIHFSVSGMYQLPHDQPAASATLSPPPENEEVVHRNPSLLRRRHQMGTWTKLFRQRWRQKKDNTTKTNLVSEHIYATLVTFHMSDISLHYTKTDSTGHQEQPFFSLMDVELCFRSQMPLTRPSTLEGVTQITWSWQNKSNDITLTVKKPVLDLCSMTHGRYNVDIWLNSVINPMLKQNPQTPSVSGTSRPKEKLPLYEILKHAKMTMSITELTVLVVGKDMALKGTRPAPENYMDNAPDKDIVSNLMFIIGRLVLEINGSGRIEKTGDMSPQRELSSFVPEQADEIRYPVGQGNDVCELNLSIQHINVQNSFQSQDLPMARKRDNELLLWISHVNAMTTLATLGPNVSVAPMLIIRKSGVRYSVATHYAILLAVRSVSHLKEHVFQKHTKPQPTVSSVPMISVTEASACFDRCDVHITLPNETRLYLRVDGICTSRKSARAHPPKVTIGSIKLFGVAPKQSDKWEQLVLLEDFVYRVNDHSDPTAATQDKHYSIVLSKWIMRIPYQYVLANVVDGSVSFFKSIKAIHARLLRDVPFTLMGPMAKNDPTRLANIRLEWEIFRLQFDDDPFESRLRLIWKNGLLEQANRIELQQAFDQKVYDLKQDSFTGKISKESDIDHIVSSARKDFEEHNLRTWIKRINHALEIEMSAYENSLGLDQSAISPVPHVKGQDNTDPPLDMSPAFLIESLPIPPHPPLLDFTITDGKLHIGPPSFPLEQTREFVHTNGKGVPLDTVFSQLMPFHLDWSAGKTWAQVRDYPIPLLHVPESPNVDGTLRGVSWKLSGDYVLGDELGSRDATRFVTVPFTGDSDLYSIQIPRTSTPVKFYSVVNIDVCSPGMSTLTWSVPFQPAIQDIMRTMDSFTRPPVDPSSKIGFWDKIRLMIHTRTKISFVGGGDLAFIMKGTRNPYDMTTNGFGLAKIWRNQVVWLLGHENDEGEFMQIISREYAFGVPDLDYSGYLAPYILPSSRSRDMNLPDIPKPFMTTQPSSSSESTDYHSGSFGSMGSIQVTKTDPRFLKIALKLSEGVRMGIGFHIERLCPPGCEKCGGKGNVSDPKSIQNRCRFLHFVPHYKVKFKTPQNVQAMGEKAKDYDAYEGFRSNFIHISISIIRLSDNNSEKVDIANATMNAMYLSPAFIDHFVRWFRLFGGAMSYPMRNGSYYPKNDPRPAKKFGRHMSTMKYKVMVHPLVIGYFYKDDNVINIDKPFENGDSVGLKAVVAAFNVDIHQRREITNVSNHKLDQKRLKANWPVHEAEVHLLNIDLRAVRASFSAETANKSMNGSADLLASLTPTSDSSDASIDANYMDDLENHFETNELSDWVDPDDFVELDTLAPKHPLSVQVLPFAYSPCMYFLKQTSRADSEKYLYLRDTHKCSLGTATDTRTMQMKLLEERCLKIKVQIRKHQARLHSVETKIREHGPTPALLKESKGIVEKSDSLSEKRDILLTYLKELSHHPMPNIDDAAITGSPAYSSSLIFGKDSLVRWEELMGYFKQRCIVHNPQIIWNNTVRNIIYHFLDLQAHRQALSYYMSARALKPLRDFMEMARQERLWKPDDDNTGFDLHMAQDLIQKLLSEQDTKFVAPNETEEALNDRNGCLNVTLNTDDARANDVNDPDAQKQSIPDGYVMKSSFLVDLLNPQISLQSDRDPSSLVLVSSERIQAKTFNIIDSYDPDVDMELVKNRSIASIDNAHIFVAKKEQFDDVDLLLDNHYGAKQSDHWLAWIPPEMLIRYVKRHDKFQRVSHNLTATVQYDKYNQLRIKRDPSLFSITHPLEDRCDSVQLNFPELSLAANSSQYNAIYEVVMDLLLYKEPAKKERLAQLREILMKSDRSSINEITENMVDLQEEIRELGRHRDDLRQLPAYMDPKWAEQLGSTLVKLHKAQEELYLGMEAIKMTQHNQRRNYNESKINLKFTFSADKVTWLMLQEDDTPLCKWHLDGTTYILVSKDDRSSTNTLEIDQIIVKNTTSSGFTDVLGPYIPDPKKVPDFSRHKMLRGHLVDLAPVGGIPVVQHLEINLSPVHLQMTYDFGKALAFYFFPVERRQKQAAESAVANSRTTTSSTTVSPSGSGTAVEGDWQRTASASFTMSTSSRFNERESNRSFRYNKGELAEELQDPRPGTESLRRPDGSADSVKDLVKLEQSFLELPANPPVQPSSGGKKGKNAKKKSKTTDVDDLSVMKMRASSNRTFILVKFPGTKHCLSYQGPKEKNIEDLRDFVFQQPDLEYRNRTWSWYELTSTIKKDFMKATLVQNSPALIREKLNIRRHPRENSNAKLIDSTMSTYSGPPANHPEVALVRLDDADQSDSSESSNDEMDDQGLEHDVVSLHSLPAEAEKTRDSRKTRHLLHWPRRLRKQKSSALPRGVYEHERDSGIPDIQLPPEDEQITTAKRHSIDSGEILNQGETSTMSLFDEELVTKGKILFGKRYNGPLHVLPVSAKSVKERRPSSTKCNGRTS